jgi:mannose-6-phosphate isomerase
VEEIQLDAGAAYEGRCDGSTFEIWGCVQGEAGLTWKGDPVSLKEIRFVLLPAALGAFRIEAGAGATLLRAYAP